MVISLPTEPKIIKDAKSEEVVLELEGKVNQILCEDYNSFRHENIKKYANSEMKKL